MSIIPMSKTKKSEQLSSLDPRVTGAIGGKKRAENLTPKRRKEIAEKASKAALAALQARKQRQIESES